MTLHVLFRSGLSVLGMGLLLFALRAGAAASDYAGQVIIASGNVYALSAQGEQRTLQRRSVFYPGETIRTAPSSEVQLRFTDGALMSLREDSEFKVDEYRFQNQGGEGDRSMSTLIKGGLRTITGVIGKQDASAYSVTTPVATIGVRGTHYEAVMESPDSLALAAWQGGIQVRNERGEIDLGAGGDFNFGRVEARSSPKGLMMPPKVLQISAPVGQRGPQPPETDAGVAEQKPLQEKPSATSPGTFEQKTADKPALAVRDVPQDAPQDAPENKPMPLGAGVFPIGPLPPQIDADCKTCVPPQQILVTSPTELLQNADLRFTAAEWDSIKTTPFLGVAVEASNKPDYGFKGGRALGHGSNSPVITDNGYAPHEPQFATAPYQAVIRRGGASSDAFANQLVDAGHTFYWGTWNGNINPVEVQTNATNPAQKALIQSPVHWATLLPTDKAMLAARTGSINLTSVVVAHGGGSGGGPLTPGNLTFNANVNFNTGAITAGTLGINNGPESWNVNFTGLVRGNIFDAQVDQGTSTVMVSPNPTQFVEGDMGMAFTGAAGQAVGGVFNFQAIGNLNTHVEGVLLVQ